MPFSIRLFVADGKKSAPEGTCRPLDMIVAKEGSSPHTFSHTIADGLPPTLM